MNIKLDRRNIILNRIAEIKTPDQWVMVTSWDAAHKPVNYLVNPKAGYAFANFLISFEYDIDVQWVTVYVSQSRSMRRIAISENIGIAWKVWKPSSSSMYITK